MCASGERQWCGGPVVKWKQQDKYESCSRIGICSTGDKVMQVIVEPRRMERVVNRYACYFDKPRENYIMRRNVIFVCKLLASIHPAVALGPSRYIVLKHNIFFPSCIVKMFKGR
jgi:hypothetical protein